MYALLPWNWLATALGIVVMAAVCADDLAGWFGITVSDRALVHYLPLAVLAILGGCFGPAGYWAPWRIAWRLCPALNKWLFPDLNGVWVGCTHSNWSTIAKMLAAAGADTATDEKELHAIPEQRDAIAVQVRATLFRLSFAASLSSTDGQSHSITAKPWREPNSDRLHLIYVYKQNTPDPTITDEEYHMGAADVVLDPEDRTKAEGVYWTRRRWKIGLNTAGKLELVRITSRKDPTTTLRQYAQGYKSALSEV